MWIFATAVFLVLVFFIYRHTKTTLKVLGGAAALILFGVWIYDAGIWDGSASRPTYLNPDSQVSVSVNYDPTTCSNASPLQVTITNGAYKTLQSIEWHIAAYVPGRSSDIAKYQFSPYKSDYILEPNKMISFCFKTPELSEVQEPSRLRWEAHSRSASFR